MKTNKYQRRYNGVNRNNIERVVYSEGFDVYLQSKGIIAKTIARHIREVVRLENYLQEKGSETYRASKKQLLDYLEFCQKSRNLSPATKNQVLMMLKNYYDYLFYSGVYLGEANPFAFVKIRDAEKKKLRKLFSEEALHQLCDLFYKTYLPETLFESGDNIVNKRHYLVLTLFCYQGLNQHEILKLSKEDIDIRKGFVTIHPSRRGAGRVLKLEPSQMGVLFELHKADEFILIPNLNHIEKLSKLIKQINRSFLDMRQLRTSRITLWIKEFGLRKAQVLAGHRNITATERYVANDIETLQNEVEMFHPLL